MVNPFTLIYPVFPSSLSSDSYLFHVCKLQFLFCSSAFFVHYMPHVSKSIWYFSFSNRLILFYTIISRSIWHRYVFGRWLPLLISSLFFNFIFIVDSLNTSTVFTCVILLFFSIRGKCIIKDQYLTEEVLATALRVHFESLIFWQQRLHGSRTFLLIGDGPLKLVVPISKTCQVWPRKKDIDVLLTFLSYSLSEIIPSL